MSKFDSYGGASYDPAFDEDGEPCEWSLLATQVEQSLKKQFSDWSTRGNREEYIASDCGRDADLEGLSTGIISIKTYHSHSSGLEVEWGWHKTFCYGTEDLPDDIREEAIESQSFIAGEGCGLGGEWDCDGDSISGSDEKEFVWTDIEEYVENPESWTMDEINQDKVDEIAKKIWDIFVQKREPLEKEAELADELLVQGIKYWEEKSNV